jgi:hypothetical protein
MDGRRQQQRDDDGELIARFDGHFRSIARICLGRLWLAL